MEAVTKNMIEGAFATGLIKAADEGIYNYSGGQGKSLRGTFPYMEIIPEIPPVDTILVDAGTPIVLYALGKGMKKQGLVNAAKGAAIFGISALLGETLLRVANSVAPVTTLKLYVVSGGRKS